MEDTRICRQVFDWEHSICRNNWSHDVKKIIQKVEGNLETFTFKLPVDIDLFIDMLDLEYKAK